MIKRNHSNKIKLFFFCFFFSVRKTLEQLIPIVRTDNDIESILTRSDQSITSILDLFIKSNSGIHVMRAIEPNLRFGTTIKNFVDQTKDIPPCEFWHTEQSDKCIRIASRKQIGDALVKYQNFVVNK